jgi:CBS domain-containing protein
MGTAPRLLAVAGTTVHAHPSWLAAWALLALTLGPRGLVAILALVAAVVIHALAQALAARAAGLRIRRVTLHVFGGVAETDGEAATVGRDALAALAGPLASLALAGVAAGARALMAQPPAGLLYMEAAGLAVAIVNLLPAEPLEGGRLVRALARRGGRPALARSIGTLVRAVILLAGVAAVARGHALAGAWLILLALLLRDAARVSDAEMALREALLPVTVREVMTRSVVAVPPDATIAQLAETFWAYHFTSYPVIASDLVLGLVDLRDVAAVDRERWPRTRVRAVMRSLSDDLTVTPGDSLLEALTKTSRNGLGRVAVMDGRHLAGYLSVDDITDVLTRRGLASPASRAPKAPAARRSLRP